MPLTVSIEDGRQIVHERGFEEVDAKQKTGTAARETNRLAAGPLWRAGQSVLPGLRSEDRERELLDQTPGQQGAQVGEFDGDYKAEQNFEFEWWNWIQIQ